MRLSILIPRYPQSYRRRRRGRAMARPPENPDVAPPSPPPPADGTHAKSNLIGGGLLWLRVKRFNA